MAAGLLAGGLIIPNDLMLGASIVASLIAAVMLYIGARQSSATRAERRAADDWDAEPPVDEYDRRDSYPTEPVRTDSYQEPEQYDVGRAEEQRFADQGRYQGDDRYGVPEPATERYDAVPQRPDDERYDTAEQPTVAEQPAGEDRFADLRQYEEAAFSDPQTAAYDRGAGYPEPPVAERMWTAQSPERVPSQRDANGAHEESVGGYSEPVPTAEEPTLVSPGMGEPGSGAHAADPVGAAAEPEPVPPPRTEVSSMTPEARRLEQLPPDEWVGGGIDEEDPKDEPPIQRRTAQVAAAVARMATDVFVIDGRPRYHVPGCVHLLGRESEPLPADEGVDLGFTPCSLCEPDTVLTSGATEKARH